MRIIYIDELFLLNFIFDYMLLLATAKICSAASKRRRLAFAAAAGALYASLAVIPGFEFLAHPALKVISGAAVLICAFGFHRRFTRIALVFFAVSAAGAGAVMALGMIGSSLPRVNLRLLSVSLIICYGAVVLVFTRAAGNTQKYVSLVLRLAGHEISLRALVDTGNSLCDPVSNTPVVIISARDAALLFPPELRRRIETAFRQDAEDALQALAGIEVSAKFRMIPFDTVGTRGGLLIAFTPDYAGINGAEKTLTAAVSPADISDNAAYDAIVPADCNNYISVNAD